jgi:hypothetical protein
MTTQVRAAKPANVARRQPVKMTLWPVPAGTSSIPWKWSRDQIPSDAGAVVNTIAIITVI